jgi:hypothetical protein
MSNVNNTAVAFVNFKVSMNGEPQPWRNGLAFESLDALVRRAKANKEVDSLFVLEATIHNGGKDEDGNIVPFYKSTRKVAYKGYRKSGGVWWADINPYKVGIDKVEIPQEVAKPESSKLAEFKVLGDYQGQAVCLCVKGSPLFIWGKLYFDMDENRLIPSKEMASIKAKMSAEPQPIVPTPKEEYEMMILEEQFGSHKELKTDDLAIQIAEDLVAEKVAAKPRKTGQTYNGKVVWFSEEDQVYYTLSKKSDGKMGRDLVSIQELRERGKITMGKK